MSEICPNQPTDNPTDSLSNFLALPRPQHCHSSVRLISCFTSRTHALYIYFPSIYFNDSTFDFVTILCSSETCFLSSIGNYLFLSFSKSPSSI